MRRLLLPVIIVAFALGMANVSVGDDHKIGQQVMLKLNQQKQAGKLRGFNIDMQVEKGSVILRGTVSTQAQLDGVLYDVRRIQGVRQVVNGLTVKPPQAKTAAASKPVSSPKPLTNPKASAVAAKPEKKEPLESVKVSSRPIQSPLKTQPKKKQEVASKPQDPAVRFAASPATFDKPKVSDENIAQAISAKLNTAKRDGDLRGFGINMQVDQGTVWLSGHVASEKQRTLVLDVARRERGVKQVVNDLSIKRPTAVSRKDNPKTAAATPVEPKKVFQVSQEKPASASSKLPASKPSAAPLGSGVKAQPLRPAAPKPLKDAKKKSALPTTPSPTPDGKAMLTQATLAQARLAQARLAQAQAALAPVGAAMPVSRGRNGSQLPLAYASAGGAGIRTASNAGMGMGSTRCRVRQWALAWLDLPDTATFLVERPVSFPLNTITRRCPAMRGPAMRLIRTTLV